TLLRNAERIVAAQTVHEIHFDKEAGPDGRVSMSHDTIGEFRPLLHPKLAPTRAELVTAIKTQYRLALVRAPTDDEVANLLALYESNLKVGDLAGAARTMLMAPLLAPEATHRFELGRGTEVRPGVRMLSSLEIAFSVNLALADRRDETLFQAAEKDELTTRESVAEHVRRMLADPKFEKPHMLQFFREYFGYHNATEVFKDKPRDVLHAPDQMVADTDQLTAYLLDQDKDVFRQLLTTTKSFVNCGVHYAKRTREKSYKRGREAHVINDKGLKHPDAVYGIDEWTDQQPVALPNDRIGILMQPSWLVAWSTNFDNDPVRRGWWIRERLLGGRVPDLPLGMVAQVPGDPHRTLRDRLKVTRAEACWKCHQRMDELGLPFEQLDHFGKARTAELVRDLEAMAKNVDDRGRPLGEVQHAAPLVTTGRIDASGDPRLDGEVKNAQELVRRIADSDRARQVFIRHVFRFTMGRNETPGDAKTLQEADAAYLASGGSYKALLVSLISSESFLCRTVPVAGSK
ncbi:MAG: DUF1588 domain-containing protein, partial [Afipia sp.]|nr:DUF1588 domain-containing protein [Afipia sp.]